MAGVTSGENSLEWQDVVLGQWGVGLVPLTVHSLATALNF